MLLAKIKEALSSLYENIQETEETPDADAAAAVEAEDTAVASAAGEVQAEETAPEQEESKPEEVAEPEEPAPPPGPKETDYKAKGYHLDVDLPPEKLPEAAEILLREDFLLNPSQVLTGLMTSNWKLSMILTILMNFAGLYFVPELIERILQYRQFHIFTRVPTGTNGKPMIFSA